MRRAALIWLLIVAFFGGTLLLPATPSYAWRHGGGRVFIGTGVLVGPSISLSVLLVSATLLPVSATRDRAAATSLRAAGTPAGAPLGLVLLQKCGRILPTDSKLPGTLDTGPPEESVRGRRQFYPLRLVSWSRAA